MLYVRITVGVVVIRDNNYNLANALTDYSYINAKGGTKDVLIARCMTGLGPTSTDNGALGGWYFNGNMKPNRARCSSAIIQPEPGTFTAGAINIYQCGKFSANAEGVYTCTIMNSTMMIQSIRLGVYFTGRSESLVKVLSNHLIVCHLSIQLLQ